MEREQRGGSSADRHEVTMLGWASRFAKALRLPAPGSSGPVLVLAERRHGVRIEVRLEDQRIVAADIVWSLPRSLSPIAADAIVAWIIDAARSLRAAVRLGRVRALMARFSQPRLEGYQRVLTELGIPEPPSRGDETDALRSAGRCCASLTADGLRLVTVEEAWVRPNRLGVIVRPFAWLPYHALPTSLDTFAAVMDICTRVAARIDEREARICRSCGTLLTPISLRESSICDDCGADEAGLVD